MKPVEILNTHNLKRTSCREGIIEVMMTAKNALSESEIRIQLSGNYDRTTFYRSFRTLEDHKIIHKIVVDSQLVKYAIANTVTGKKEHAHFYCSECNTVKCMDYSPVQEIKLPDGYTEEETEVIIKGTCPFCKSKPTKN